MSFTYDPSKSDAISKIRAVLSDTDPANPLKSDQEISGWLASLPDWAATAQLAREIAGDFARKVSSFSASGTVAVSWRDRQQHYEDLAKLLETRQTLTYAMVAVAPLAGGLLDAYGNDVLPYFTRLVP